MNPLVFLRPFWGVREEENVFGRDERENSYSNRLTSHMKCAILPEPKYSSEKIRTDRLAASLNEIKVSEAEKSLAETSDKWVIPS